jgi:RNA polymerase sigma factor (sigma-70 family)
MRPRQEIVEIFSSFLQFSADNITKWVTDSKLYRSMSENLNQSPQLERSRSDWALYWHRVWRNQPEIGADFQLARGHLYAYMQEVGYKVAKKIKQNLESKLPEYTIEDFFQIAIANADKVLKGFEPTRHPHLEGYAYPKLGNLIKDQLVQEGVEAAYFRSGWSLLRDSSEKRICESLQQRGLSTADIERYILAWECFKMIYVPQKPRGNSQLAAPDSTTWDAIAQLYNQEQLAQLSQSTPINATTIQNWMSICIEAIRAYLAPRPASLDASVFNEDNKSQNFPPSNDPTPLEKLLDEEEAQNRRSSQEKINSVLNYAVSNLNLQTQELFQLYYGEGLNQKEISSRLKISQPTISRRCKQFKTESIQTLQASVNISLTPEVIKNMNGLIDEWLEQYYGKDNEV